MKVEDVLFLGGDVDRLASVKIRCREVARRLGARALYGIQSVKDVPRGYRAYICVKPDFPRYELIELAKYGGLVVWDILDAAPPSDGVNCYIASTEFVKVKYMSLGKRIEVVHHYHCNFSGQVNRSENRTAGYIGSVHWYPHLKNIEHRACMVDRAEWDELEPMYRSIGIGINIRNLRVDGRKWATQPNDIVPVPVDHIALNSGVKLLNCVGYGIPSLSSVEPAYLELAPDCTMFTDQLACAEHLLELQRDGMLYNRIRNNCISEARRFTVDTIMERYKQLLRSL